MDDDVFAKAIAAGVRAYIAAAPKVTSAHGDYDLLLFHRILPLFETAGLLKAEKLAGPPLRYPDGTLHFLISDRAVFAEIAEDLFIDLGAANSIQDTQLWILVPRRRYTLYYGGAYQRLLGEGRFLAGEGLKVWPGNHVRNELQVTIWFVAPPADDVRQKFVQRVGEWLRSTACRGVFEEGPVTAVEPKVEFRGKRASIRLDVSRTGPRTLIWFILTMLDFGHAVLPVSAVPFNEDDPLSVQTSIECARNAARYVGSEFTDADEKNWLQERQGGPGPSIVLDIPR